MEFSKFQPQSPLWYNTAEPRKRCFAKQAAPLPGYFLCPDKAGGTRMAGASKAARLPDKCLDAQKCTKVQQVQKVQKVQKSARIGAQNGARISKRNRAGAKGNANTQDTDKIPAVTVSNCGITAEIVKGNLPTSLNCNLAQSWGSYPTKDGRYVYEFQDGSGKNRPPIKVVLSGLSPELLEYLKASDQNATNCQRQEKDHACYDAGSKGSGKGISKGISKGNGGTDGDLDDFCTAAMDRAAYEQWLRKETWEDRVEDPPYPDELLKTGFVAGENKVNNQKTQMRLQVIKQFIRSLPYKQQETVIKYYQMRMTLESIGAEEGTKKQAICNRISRMEDDIREVFTRLGITVPTKEELAKEAAETAARWKAVKKAEKEREDEEAEIRAISAVVCRKSRGYVREAPLEGMRDEPGRRMG